MESVYIAVEKNVEVFELYKKLWKEQQVNGIMAGSMSFVIFLKIVGARYHMKKFITKFGKINPGIFAPMPSEAL